MIRLCIFIGMTIGGYLGWWLGAQIGVMTAFILSMLGTGVGLYLAKRWATEHWA